MKVTGRIVRERMTVREAGSRIDGIVIIIGRRREGSAVKEMSLMSGRNRGDGMRNDWIATIDKIMTATAHSEGSTVQKMTTTMAGRRN